MLAQHPYWRLALYIIACASCAVGQESNAIRIDDSNVYSLSNPTGIQYGTLGWSPITTNDSSQRYQGTYTQSQTFGSQLWFAFRGSSITYYADKAPGNGSVAISIDGGTGVSVNWTNTGTTMLYQQSIWSAGGLDSGDHTVVIGNRNLNNDSIGLDYFAVTPWSGADIAPQNYGPGASSVLAKAVLVDNESNDVRYSGSAWESYWTNSNGTTQAMYFNHTQHCTRIPGAVATFQFNGTALWCFSDDFASSSQIKLSIDGKGGHTVDTATTGHGWTSQKLFWNVTGLSPESHTVSLTHVGSVGDYACIDFFISASPVAPSPTPIPTPIPTQPSESSSSSKSVPAGAIAGGTVGGVAVIALLIALVIYYRRRRSRKLVKNPRHETYIGDAAYQTKQVDPAYNANKLDPVPTLDQRPHGSYSYSGEGASATQTAWTGPTYKGHPELQ